MNPQTLLVLVPAALLVLGITVHGFALRETGHRHGLGHSHGEGVFSIDVYAHESKIADWNAGFKMSFALILMLFCVVSSNLYVCLLVILFCAYVTISIGGLTFRRYLGLLTIPLVFMIIGSIVILVEFASAVPENAVWSFSFGWFCVYSTRAGILTTLNLWGRAFGAISAMYMMSLSTPSAEIFSALRRAHVPALLIELMNMMYRFVFVMMDTHTQMTIAAKSRLGYKNYRTAMKSFGMTAGNLLIVSFEKANRYYDALESRLYTGEMHFLEEPHPVSAVQWAVSAGVIAYLVLILIVFEHVEVPF